MKNPGKLVITKNGKKGRTYNKKGLVNGKVPVYLIEEELVGFKHAGTAINTMPILCEPSSLKITGYID